MNIYNLYKHYLLECTTWDAEEVVKLSIFNSDTLLEFYSPHREFYSTTVSNQDFLNWLEGKS